jgi:NAD(P)-dependent dehydrogenase (short-subunit alcohol dehydrogenase family)
LGRGAVGDGGTVSSPWIASKLAWLLALGHEATDVAEISHEENRMTQDIDGKVVVITGASSGLGEAAARHLAKGGAKLVLGARRIDRLNSLAKELSLPAGAVVQTDVSKNDQVKGLVDQAVKAHGRVDVIINNAGVMPLSPLERLKIDDWGRMIDVNIKGVLYGIAAVMPHMMKQKPGTSSTCPPSPATRCARAARSMRPPNRPCA